MGTGIIPARESDHGGAYRSGAAMIRNSVGLFPQEFLAVRDLGRPAAFRTFGRKFVIGREGVGIQHGKAENEDDDLPRAERDLQWPWISRYMRRFAATFGTIVTIRLDRIHDSVLFSQTMLWPKGITHVPASQSLMSYSRFLVFLLFAFPHHSPDPPYKAHDKGRHDNYSEPRTFHHSSPPHERVPTLYFRTNLPPFCFSLRIFKML
jgi:hypothetical protein